MTIPAEKPESPPKLIVGLGNPGPRHRFTRHNAGFDFIDRLKAHAHLESVRHRPDLNADTALICMGGARVLLLKPLSYMNRSGDAARRTLAFRKWPASAMLVAHDDLDLPPGAARIKFGGGHGGHKGLADVIAHCGADFLRLRLGIGRPAPAQDLTPYVLSPPAPDEQAALNRAMQASLSALATLYASGLQTAMNELHAPAAA